MRSRVALVGIGVLMAFGACSDNTRYSGGEGSQEPEPCVEDAPCEVGEETSDEPCGEGELSCRATTSCGESVFCRDLSGGQPPDGEPEEPPCDGVATCEQGELNGEACFVGEVDCRMESLCGTVTFCRAAEGCLAFPTCEANQNGTRLACLDGEEGCEVASICGETLFCRDNPGCRAVPTCEDDEFESDEPCTVIESACRVEVACGQAIACRPAR